jgi:hypothetical protein
VKGSGARAHRAPHHRGPHRPEDRALSAVICVGRFDHPMILARHALSCPARAARGPQLSQSRAFTSRNGGRLQHGQHLRPHDDHPDEQGDGCQCSDFFDDGPYHVALPALRT